MPRREALSRSADQSGREPPPVRASGARALRAGDRQGVAGRRERHSTARTYLQPYSRVSRYLWHLFFLTSLSN